MTDMTNVLSRMLEDQRAQVAYLERQYEESARVLATIRKLITGAKHQLAMLESASNAKVSLLPFSNPAPLNISLTDDSDTYGTDDEEDR